MENTPVTYDRISQDPTNFESVFTRQLSLADDLRNGHTDYRQGTAESKALHGANRTLETDLSARMFEHRLDVHRTRQRALPGSGEQSSDARLTDQRSHAQGTDSAAAKSADGKRGKK